MLTAACLSGGDIKSILMSAWGILCYKNWFIGCYFVLMFIAPWLNESVDKGDRDSIRKLLATLIIDHRLNTNTDSRTKRQRSLLARQVHRLDRHSVSDRKISAPIPSRRPIDSDSCQDDADAYGISFSVPLQCQFASRTVQWFKGLSIGRFFPIDNA